jgi:hypothetical protein
MQTAESYDRLARIRRIKSRGCPEIVQALERGECGIKLLERLSKLPPQKQSIELARHLQERKAAAERQAAWRADPRATKTPFASQAYAEARTRRLRRIAKRATAELQEAYDEGRLSLRAYDRLSKLSPLRQRQALQTDRNKERAQTQAAAVIRIVLTCQPRQIDLALIARQIIASIRSN